METLIAPLSNGDSIVYPFLQLKKVSKTLTVANQFRSAMMKATFFRVLAKGNRTELKRNDLVFTVVNGKRLVINNKRHFATDQKNTPPPVPKTEASTLGHKTKLDPVNQVPPPPKLEPVSTKSTAQISATTSEDHKKTAEDVRSKQILLGSWKYRIQFHTDHFFFLLSTNE